MAILAGAAVGLIAVGAFAAPASAHQATIRGNANCDTSRGEYVVTWTVSNDFRSTATRGRVNALPEGSTVDLGRDIPGYGSITGTQRVPGTSRFAGIELDYIMWRSDDHVQRDGLRKVISLPANCSVPKPPPGDKPPAPKPPNTDCVGAEVATFSHTFDGAKGTATVKLNGNKPLCKGADQSFALISYTVAKEPAGQEKKFDSVTGTISPKKKSVDFKVKLPPCALKVYLVFDKDVIDTISATENYGDRVLGSKGKPGSLSTGVLGTYTGAGAECGGKPAVTFENTCENVTITLINDGTEPAQFNGFTKIGDGAYQPVPKPFTVDPGKRATFAVEPVKPGLSVKVTSGSFSQEHTWAAPEECAEPSGGTEPSPTPGEGGGLPVTGAGLGGLIAAALAVTGAGAAMVILARRRRQQTA